jgi:hypothetical protein
MGGKTAIAQSNQKNKDKTRSPNCQQIYKKVNKAY